MELKRKDEGLWKPFILEFLELWAPKWTDVLQGHTFQDTQVCATALCPTQALHFWSTKIWRFSLKFAPKPWLSTQCQSQLYLTWRTDCEQILHLHSKSPKIKCGFQQDTSLGHMAMMNWSGSMTIFLSTNRVPWATQNYCFSPFNVCSGYYSPTASAACHWVSRDIYKATCGNQSSGSFHFPCEEKNYHDTGSASSWAYISKPSLTIEGDWYPSEQVGGFKIMVNDFSSATGCTKRIC